MTSAAPSRRQARKGSSYVSIVGSNLHRGSVRARQLGSGADAELRVDPGEIRLPGADGDEEGAGDLTVRPTRSARSGDPRSLGQGKRRPAPDGELGAGRRRCERRGARHRRRCSWQPPVRCVYATAAGAVTGTTTNLGSGPLARKCGNPHTLPELALCRHVLDCRSQANQWRRRELNPGPQSRKRWHLRA